MCKVNIVVVGATGLVGRTLLKVLEERQIAIGNLKLIASAKSVGQKLTVFGKEYPVEPLSSACFAQADFIFFCAGGKVSEQYVNDASKQGIVIDNSSAFRMKPDVPLVVASINGETIKNHRIIANANCSIIPCVTILKTLDDHFHLTSVNYATYQSVSGNGLRGMSDLIRTQKNESQEFYPYPIAKTCIPLIGEAISTSETSEEKKMQDETKKILNRPDLKVSATCIRVPILYCHGIVVSAQTEQPFALHQVKELIAKIPKVIILDDLFKNEFPVSTIATDTDNIYIGRIRYDETKTNGLLFYVLADNLRVGAASSSVDIMQYLIDRNDA